MHTSSERMRHWSNDTLAMSDGDLLRICEMARGHRCLHVTSFAQIQCSARRARDSSLPC